MHQSSPLLSLLGLVASGDLGGTTMYKSHQGKVVAFAKTYPGPTRKFDLQLSRARFQLANEMWTNLLDSQKHLWDLTTNAFSLRMSGHALYLASVLRPDIATVAVFERRLNAIVWPDYCTPPPPDGRPLWPAKLEPLLHDFSPTPTLSPDIHAPSASLRLGCSMPYTYVARSSLSKHFLFVCDPTLPSGVITPLSCDQTGPGTTDPLVACNGVFARLYFHAPPQSAYTTLHLWYTSPHGPTASTILLIETRTSAATH